MKIIEILPSERVGKRKYTMGLFLCPVCNETTKKIKREGLKAKSCSHKCYAKTREQRGAYKKKIVSKKYVYIYSPDHPNAIGTKKLYVAEHRLVVEKALSRYLTSEEIVHHKDGNTLNNDIENLQIMTASEHSSLHAKLRTRGDK